MMKKFHILLILSTCLISPFGSTFAQNATKTGQLYVDPETGNVYDSPAPNRKPLKFHQNKKKDIENQNSDELTKKEKKKNQQKLKISGMVQVRAISAQRESTFSNGHDFNSADWNFRRIRLGAEYSGAPWWGVLLNMRIEDSLDSSYVTQKKNNSGYLTDVAYHGTGGGIIQKAGVWFKLPIGLTASFGQFKIPFMRENMMSSTRLIFVERAMSNSILQRYDIGGFLEYNPLEPFSSKYGQYLTLFFSATNGRGSSLQGVGRHQVLTNTMSNTRGIFVSPLINWRIEINPFGGLDKKGKDSGWKEGNEIFQRDTKLSIGYAGVETRELQTNNSYDPMIRGVSPVSLNIQQATPDNGYGIGPSASAINLYGQPYDNTNFLRPSLGIVGHTADFTFTSHGIYASGQYTLMGGSAGKRTTGYMATLGYAIPWGEWLFVPLVRYDRMWGDFNNDRRLEPSETLINLWYGITIYAAENDLKFQIFYENPLDRLGANPWTGNPRNAKNNMFYFQIQSMFNTDVL